MDTRPERAGNALDTKPAVSTPPSDSSATRGFGTESAFLNNHAVTRPGNSNDLESEGKTTVDTRAASTKPPAGAKPCTDDVHKTPNAIRTNNQRNMKTTMTYLESDNQHAHSSHSEPHASRKPESRKRIPNTCY